MPRPLNGYRIVDLTSMILGPTGAAASPPLLNNNRGKRSVALDLKDSAAVEALLRLAAKSFIVRTTCWSSDARGPSASPDPGRGRGQCAPTPDPCTKAG